MSQFQGGRKGEKTEKRPPADKDNLGHVRGGGLLARSPLVYGQDVGREMIFEI